MSNLTEKLQETATNMATYRIFSEANNGFENEIIVNSSASVAKAEMSLYLSENKENLCRANLSKWDNEEKCYFEVPCKLSFYNF